MDLLKIDELCKTEEIQKLRKNITTALIILEDMKLHNTLLKKHPTLN